MWFWELRLVLERISLMIEKDRTEEIASTHLGKRVEMCDQYNPNLLVAVPRIDNRRHYNIDNNIYPVNFFFNNKNNLYQLWENI